jgi:hypothetical protein
MILQKISKHPITGANRAIRLKEITYINWDLKEANVIWEEVYLDKKDKPIFDDTITNRTIVSHISNHNKVTEQGIVIEPENFPDLKAEELEEIKEKAFPEFDFYISAVINTKAIEQSIQMLDHMKRFDRK